MLSKQDNETIHRVGPGTPMGELMRQYWIPAVMSSELAEPDGRPMRLRLLGEDLIAFRATSGQVGIVANNCPHRGASLYFGRNEEEGLRCVYHGWKFDVSGKCVDMPNEPAESNFKDKVKAVAYPTQERNGVVWIYIGPRETVPSLPDLEPNLVEDCRVSNAFRSCNWLQGLEGDIDTSHLAFLHLGSVQPEDTKEGTFNYYTVKDRAPRYLAVDTGSGTYYGAYRPGPENEYYWRFAAFLFPFYTIIPTGILGLKVNIRAWVPVDDDHMMFWSMTPASRGFDGSGGNGRGNQSGFGPAQAGAAQSQAEPGNQFRFLPNTSDWLGRWRLTANAENDYLMDWDEQRADKSYTGIPGIHTQDQAITESMGTLQDRTNEHLGSSDLMIIRTRKRILDAAAALNEKGVTPPGVDDPTVYRIRGGGTYLPREADWLEATDELRKAFVEHPDVLEQAKAGRF
jgi:phenylpropionate dioxygenase-like ring-hydroxylating dioxygenase large terminal subunit